MKINKNEFFISIKNSGVGISTIWATFFVEKCANLKKNLKKIWNLPLNKNIFINYFFLLKKMEFNID